MEESESLDKDCSLKKKIFNIIQIGDKSNRISRAFDIFITITIVLNILVTFAQTFDELSRITMGLKAIEYVTLGIFCVEYVLRIWTAEYLYPNIGRRQAKLRFLISFDYRSSFRSPVLIQPVFRRTAPKIRVRTAGRRKQIRRIPSHILAPPPMAV